MKRPKRFLFLILILLVINILFFLMWYVFDLQGIIKGIAEREIGKALKGKARIASLSIGERQVLAKGLVFESHAKDLSIKADQIRIRYNLLKVIASGFKLRNLLDQVDIHRPDVTLKLKPTPGKKKAPGTPFRMPELAKIYHSISVTEGRFTFEGEFPMRIINPGDLRVVESLSEINIRAKNQESSTVLLTAKGSSGGLIKLNAEFDKRRLARGEAEISNLSPRYLSHPDIKDLGTELNLAVSGRQASPDSRILFDAQALVWNTRGLFLDKYPVEIPFISASYNGDRLIGEVTSLKVGNSVASANIQLEDLLNDPTLIGSIELENLDLALAEQGINGNLRAGIDISGSVSEPILTLTADSNELSYAGETISDVALQADYADDIISYRLVNARWRNQNITAEGSANTESREISGSLKTMPIGSELSSLAVSGAADYLVKLYGSLPEIALSLRDLNLDYDDLSLRGIKGEVSLIPADNDNGKNSYFANCSLSGDDGYSLTLIGDVLDQNLLLDMSFDRTSPASIYSIGFLKDIDPELSGTLKAIMSGSSITTRADLSLSTRKNFAYSGAIRVLGNYDLKSGDAAVHISGNNGVFNDKPVDLQLSAQKTGSLVTVNSFRVNDLVSLSGSMDLKDKQNTAFDLALIGLSSRDIEEFYPGNGLNLPEFSDLSVVANYTNEPEKFLDARINLREFLVDGIYPLAAKIRLIGPPDECLLSGDVFSSKRNLVRLTGDMVIADKVKLNARARVEDLSPDDVVYDSPVKGWVSGVFTALYDDLIGRIAHPILGADVRIADFSAPDVSIDNIDLVAEQGENTLKVFKLSAEKPGVVKLTGSGALDYNILNNRFTDGDNELSLNVDGQLFSWVDGLVDYITDAGGRSTLNCSIGTDEEQFVVKRGSLDITNGFLRIKDQPEAVRDIVIKGNFDNNKFILDTATMNVGPGKIILNNHFREDISNHFQIGFIDLGVFDLNIDDPGILGNIPLFTPPRSLANVAIKGQNSKFATVMGPFDDMKISAHAYVSNTSAVYPPNTDNLLKMIYSMRGSTSKGDDTEPAPLPFKLDLMITLQENVSYVTYPTNFKINPGSYLHIIYDGHIWHLNEATFTSERGSIDFFGTVFENQNLNVFILESRDIIQINGNFVKRAPDGTLVTLQVTTDNDPKKSFISRLKFDLTSDNPEDRSATSVLSRLRYNQTEDQLSSTQRQNLLSDEAANLIGGNLNTSILSPILYPIENSIRRFLKLDTFTIKAGFIQNLFTEYSADPQKLADFTDLRQFNNDVMQFSSSILLNNLSLSLSKYLGKRLFLDYSLTLQEATDLQKNTVVLIAHDTSLRLMLPYKLRLSYDLKYEPREDVFTHGIMLKRSIVFDGF